MKSFYINLNTTFSDCRYHYLADNLEALLLLNGWVKTDSCPEVRFILNCDNSNVGPCGKAVRVIFSSEIPHYYAEIAECKSYFLIVRDIDSGIVIPARNTAKIITYPVPRRMDYAETATESDKFRVLVSFSCGLRPESNVYKLISVLNRFSDADIICYSSDSRLQSCLNAGVSVHAVDPSLDEAVEGSDLVIGSGHVIVAAIIRRKPFIIVGERGYGGIPDHRNIFLFHNELFMGAVGGNFGTPVPESLVIDDIRSIVCGEATAVSDAVAEELSRRSYASIEDALSSLFKSESNPCGLNLDYTIISDSNQYLLLNRYTRRKILDLDRHTAEALAGNRIADINPEKVLAMKQENIIINH